MINIEAKNDMLDVVHRRHLCTPVVKRMSPIGDARGGRVNFLFWTDDIFVKFLNLLGFILLNIDFMNFRVATLIL